jgi:hypothetical protein
MVKLDRDRKCLNRIKRKQQGTASNMRATNECRSPRMFSVRYDYRNSRDYDERDDDVLDVLN